MRTLCIWGLLLLVNLSWAQGLDVQSDPRLSQPVSLRVAAAPLHQLLRQLERQSGVELRVEQSLREYRAFARLQSRPLHQTLRLLADAFALEWRAEPVSDAENAPLRYVLYQPEAERKREAEYRAVLGMDIIDLVREALKLIPPDLLERSYEDFCALMGLTLDASSRYPYAEGMLLPQVSLPKPAETQEARARALLAARHQLLDDSARTLGGLFTLRMLATLTDAEWRDLRTKGCLRLSPDRLPIGWRKQWEQDCIRLFGYTPEEVEQYQPPPANPNVVYTAIDLLARLKAVLRGEYYAECLYDARTSKFNAHQTIYTSDSISTSGLIDLDGLRLLQAVIAAREPNTSDTPDWLVKTPDYPIQRITEKAWAEAIPRQWVDWLSFHIVEGLQSAGAEGIGEFYPLSVSSAEGKARWRELLQELIQFYTLEQREGVWLFQARERYLARAIDAPASTLNTPIAAPLPTLDDLAAIASRLSMQPIAALAQTRRTYLFHYELESLQKRYHLDAWADNLRLVGEHKRHYYALLWYAALNATQRATLQRGLPISYSAMTPPQRALFETAIHANDFICAQPTPIDPENARALFTLEQGEQEVHMALDKQIKRMNRRSYQLQFYRVQNSSDLFEFGYYLPSE